MKKTILCILMVCTMIMTSLIPAGSVEVTKEVVTEAEFMSYIEEVLPRYMSCEESGKYGIVKITSGLQVVNGLSQNCYLFLVMNDDTYMGRMSVAYIEGRFHSSFMFDSNSDMDFVLKNKIPFALVSCNGNLMLCTDEGQRCISGIHYSSDLDRQLDAEEITFSFPEIIQLNGNIAEKAKQAETRTEYYVSLNVPYVANSTVNGEKICWAACIAAVSNFRMNTHYRALDIYNALNDSYLGTPEGNNLWYRRGFSYCGMSCTCTSGMEFTDLYQQLTNNKPVVFDLYRNNGTEMHSVVCKYFMGGNEYSIYGFMDPDKSSTVYVNFYDPDLDPDNFTYIVDDIIYDEWQASRY